MSPSVSIRAGRAIDPFAHIVQHTHANLHVAYWNIVNQLAPQLQRGRMRPQIAKGPCHERDARAALRQRSGDRSADTSASASFALIVRTISFRAVGDEGRACGVQQDLQVEVGRPVDKMGPIETKMMSPIHRAAPAFDGQEIDV